MRRPPRSCSSCGAPAPVGRVGNDPELTSGRSSRPLNRRHAKRGRGGPGRGSCPKGRGAPAVAPAVPCSQKVSSDCSRQATASPKRRCRRRSSPRLRVACAHELRSPSSSNTCVLWTSAMAASFLWPLVTRARRPSPGMAAPRTRGGCLPLVCPSFALAPRRRLVACGRPERGSGPVGPPTQRPRWRALERWQEHQTKNLVL